MILLLQVFVDAGSLWFTSGWAAFLVSIGIAFVCCVAGLNGVLAVLASLVVMSVICALTLMAVD